MRGDKPLIKSVEDYFFFAFLWNPAIVFVWNALFDEFDSNFHKGFLISLLISEVTLFMCFWGSHLISILERIYLSWRGFPQRKRSIPFEVLQGCIFMIPGMYVGFEVAGLLSPLIDYNWAPPRLSSYKQGVMIGLFNTALFLAVFLKFEADNLKKRSEEERKEAESRTLKAQVAALTAQMNPHLLFNSLNSIAAMVPDEPAKAEDMTVALSRLYRQVLDASKRERHTLADELQLCRSYLEIERFRFGNRMNFSFEVDEKIDQDKLQIPVLLLQPLVENAAKHGLAPLVEGGKITLRVMFDESVYQILVEDNGAGLSHTPRNKGSGTGIENTRSRLRLAFGEDSNLELSSRANGGTQVAIRIPREAVRV